jgi:hypothetical protein
MTPPNYFPEGAPDQPSGGSAQEFSGINLGTLFSCHCPKAAVGEACPHQDWLPNISLKIALLNKPANTGPGVFPVRGLLNALFPEWFIEMLCNYRGEKTRKYWYGRKSCSRVSLNPLDSSCLITSLFGTFISGGRPAGDAFIL